MNIKRKTEALMRKYGIDFCGNAFSYGNKKIPMNHLIVNTGSALRCPSYEMHFCTLKSCYAKSCERIRPQYRHKNECVGEFFKRATVEDIIELIDAYIDDAPVDITHIRWMEACDFHSQKEIDIVNAVCEHCKNRYDIISYAWTCRPDLDFSHRNFYLNASRYDVQNADRYFFAVPKAKFDEIKCGNGIMKCPGGEQACKRCHLCQNGKFHGTIYCKIHYGNHSK